MNEVWLKKSILDLVSEYRAVPIETLHAELAHVAEPTDVNSCVDKLLREQATQCLCLRTPSVERSSLGAVEELILTPKDLDVYVVDFLPKTGE